MTLLSEKVTTMPQVSTTMGPCPLDQSQTFSPSLGTVTRLMPLVAELAQYHSLSCQFQLTKVKKEVLLGAPFSIASYSPNSSSGFTKFNLM